MEIPSPRKVIPHQGPNATDFPSLRKVTQRQGANSMELFHLLEKLLYSNAFPSPRKLSICRNQISRNLHIWNKKIRDHNFRDFYLEIFLHI
jgi:hypothetical protein